MVTQRQAPNLLLVLCGLGDSGDTICGSYYFDEPVEVLAPVNISFLMSSNPREVLGGDLGEL